jgi:hypothetical protein BACCOPRO_00572
MQLIYLYHSGFALLFDRMTVVFDFYEDSLGPNSGCLHSDLLRRPVPLYVLASHFHADHFNPHIFSWREQKADVRYILSKDIWRHRRSCCRDVEAHWLIKDGTYTDDLLSVRAFGSTDVGVSFLLETEGLKIFHAGDLNNWHWMDECAEAEWKGYEKNYLHELQHLADYTTELDLAMFPVDPRLGQAYCRGPQQFVEKIRTRYFVPMHFDESVAAAEAFEPQARAAGSTLLLPRERGRKFTLFTSPDTLSKTIQP